MIRLALAVILATPPPVAAETLSFPGNAVPAAEETTEVAEATFPTGPWTDGTLPVGSTEGQLTRQAWRIDATGLGTIQLMRPLREQLRNAGYDVTFECDTEGCGGFDFRFALDLLDPPAMQVNLADFRYLSAIHEADAVSIGILVSRTPDAGYIHVSRSGQTGTELASAEGPPARSAAAVPLAGTLTEELETIGRHVLVGLTFETGSSQLSDGSFDALQDLADYLADRPDRTVALVGHTDSSGALDGNIALSKRRAGSVLERLVTDYGVNRQQLDAQGMGYLSPVASNLTEEGRTLNRRVEVIVTSTE